MNSYIAIWRRERRTIEWGIDYANKGSGEILGEGTRVSQVYTAAGEYDKTRGGDGEIGHRFRIVNPTGLHCVDCLADVPPWGETDFIQKDGLCPDCRERKAKDAALEYGGCNGNVMEGQ